MKAVGLLCLLAGSAAADPLSLEETVRAARLANERARIDERTYAAAAARVDQARSFFLPQLTLVGTYTRRSQEITRDIGAGQTVIVQQANALNGSATLSLTLFDPRSIPLYRQALLERESARAASGNDVRLLSFDVANGYLQALGAAMHPGIGPVGNRLGLFRILRPAERRVEDGRALELIDCRRVLLHTWR